EAVPPPSSRVPGLPKALDEAVMRGLDRDLTRRYQSARDFAAALERCCPAASATDVGSWVEALGGSDLGERARRVKDIESRSDVIAARGAQRTVPTIDVGTSSAMRASVASPTV